MRVRPQRPTGRRRRGLRHPHAVDHAPAPPAGDHPDAPGEAGPDEHAGSGAIPGETFGDHVAEARHRAAVKPEDQALYRCSCGYQFEASVTASVACPHCGVGQAW